jgi:ATP-dependent exoDNAse (exonuclease V) alpha subunit
LKEEKEEFIITPTFQKASDYIINTHNSAVILGDAGTGKSSFIKWIIEKLKKEKRKKYVLLAPTGVAAVNIGGQTIHSFFGFPPKPLTQNNIPIIQDPNKLITYQKVDTIIIDEISMVRSDLMEAINHFLQINLNSGEPFGGKQIIMIGDLSQLPPVIGSQAEQDMILDQFDSEFFFDANVFKEFDYKVFYFNRIFRQKDKEFLELLNRIKYNELIKGDIDFINRKCLIDSYEEFDAEMTLCSTNRAAEAINKFELDKLEGEPIELQGQIEGYFNVKTSPVDEVIYTKIGAKMMILVNDRENGYYSGTVGKLVKYVRSEEDYHEDYLVLELDGGKEVTIKRYEYETTKFKYNRVKGDIEQETSGKFVQFPLTVCYGITIHKAQGKTLNSAVIDFGNGAFAHGQVYVALSRCRTMDGIKLLTPLKYSDIKYDKRVKNYIWQKLYKPAIDRQKEKEIKESQEE